MGGGGGDGGGVSEVRLSLAPPEAAPVPRVREFRRTKRRHFFSFLGKVFFCVIANARLGRGGRRVETHEGLVRSTSPAIAA
eukprot:3812919-Rhodomonas_salina.1